jgi:RNA polymerase sigma-70 factor, ECF subfamily
MQTKPKTIIPSDISDQDLAALIAGGDQDAFAFLMRRHNQRLFRTARSILRNDSEAEDAVQDAYILAYSSIGQFRADASLATWLTRIVVNVALGQLRKTTRRTNIAFLHGEPGADNDSDDADLHESSAESPEAGVMRAQARALLESSIEALPDAFRTVFVLRAVEEMSGEEVGLCLGIPEATVRSRFFRARNQLRASLLMHADFALEEAYSFDGERCDRIVATVLSRVAAVG